MNWKRLSSNVAKSILGFLLGVTSGLASPVVFISLIGSAATLMHLHYASCTEYYLTVMPPGAVAFAWGLLYKKNYTLNIPACIGALLVLGRTIQFADPLTYGCSNY